jgi:DNA-binding transcriptional MerR regulator
VDKAPDAFRTISEVADELDVPQHVLRFWETRFPQIKPMKRGGGRRYYRPDDVDLLRGIRHLLYGEGYTIRGVQRLLKDNGLRFVQGVWKADAPQPEGPKPEDAEDSAEAAADVDEDDADEPEDDEAHPAAGERIEPVMSKPARPATVTLTRANPVAHAPEAAATEHVRPPEAVAPVMPAQRAAPPVAPAPVFSLSAEDRKRLDAALFELGECRRLLDAALKE